MNLRVSNCLIVPDAGSRLMWPPKYPSDPVFKGEKKNKFEGNCRVKQSAKFYPEPPLTHESCPDYVERVGDKTRAGGREQRAHEVVEAVVVQNVVSTMIIQTCQGLLCCTIRGYIMGEIQEADNVKAWLKITVTAE